jgi:hypothetical protein
VTEQVLEKSKKLVEIDKQRTLEIAKKAHEHADSECGKFFDAHKEAVMLQSFDPVAEHLNKVIEDTKTFGLAQILVEELTRLTDTLNESLEKSKPLFGKIDREKQAKAETYRAVFMAHWLRSVVNELKD